MDISEYAFCSECCKIKHEDNFITCLVCNSMIKNISMLSPVCDNTYICNATLCARKSDTLNINGILQPICFGCKLKQNNSRFKKIK